MICSEVIAVGRLFLRATLLELAQILSEISCLIDVVVYCLVTVNSYVHTQFLIRYIIFVRTDLTMICAEVIVRAL